MEIEDNLKLSAGLNKKSASAIQRSSSVLKQSKLEQFGIRSPLRSLFTDSRKILVPTKQDEKKTSVGVKGIEELENAVKKTDLNRNLTRESVINTLRSNRQKLPAINLERLSDSFTTKIINKKCPDSDENNDFLKYQDNDNIKDIKPTTGIRNKHSKSTSDSSDNDNDDELLEVEFLKPSKKNCFQPSPVTSKNDTKLSSSYLYEAKRRPYIEPQYNFGLNLIFNERESQVDKRKEILEMETELIKKPNLDLKRPNENVSDENGLNLEQFKFEAQHIASQHPGIEVFDLSKCYQLYHSPSFPIIFPQNSVQNSLDYLLANTSAEDFPRILPLVELDSRPKILSEQPCMLSYFFHLLASHTKPHVIYSCYKILVSVHEYTVNNLKDPNMNVWAPTLLDLVAVLMNYGASLSMLHPEPTLLPFTEEEVHTKFGKDANQTSLAETKEQVFSDDNLKKVLDIFSRFEEIPNVYSNEDLMNIIVFCLALELDQKLMEVVIERELLLCIGNALARFTNDFWENKIIDLAKLLLKLSSHHHDMVVMARLMPYSERGLQLQKIIAYNALHILMDVEMGSQKLTIKPHHVLEFFKKHVQNNIKDDFYLFSSVVALMDLCIGKTLSKSSRATLLDFITLLKDCASKIRDSIHCSDATEVKNYIINLATNWTFLVQNLPSSQVSLLKYTSAHYKIDQLVEEGCEEDNITEVGTAVNTGI